MATIYSPSKGYGQNPLCDSKLRNFKCPCGSQIKVKKCCGRVLYIPQQYVAGLQEWAGLVEEGVSEYTAEKLKQLLASYHALNQQNLIIQNPEEVSSERA